MILIAGTTYNTTLRYDHIARQTEETKRDAGNNVVYSLGYGYDAVGNRATRTLGGATITYVYDDNDRMTSASGGGQSASFGYDNNGNMTSVSGTMYGSKTLVYNDDNRLTSLTYGAVTDLYYYKFTGQRYRARLNRTYYRYLYNGERVLEELNDSGTMQARYTTEDGSYSSQWLHLHRPSGGLSRFPMYDKIGSARGLLDASGTATDWYELDTFGRQVSTSGSTPNSYRFGAAWGYVTDPSGFLQLGERHYWPEVGRFVQRDPMQDGADWYAYVGDDPVVAVDPEGLFKDLPADWKKCLSDSVGGNTIFGKTPEERAKYKKMARCIIYGESGDDPTAKNPNSSASGLMQIMKCHDKGCTKMLGHPFDAFDPCDNIKCGVAVLAGAVKHGNLSKVYVSTDGNNRAYNKCMKDYEWKYVAQ